LREIDDLSRRVIIADLEHLATIRESLGQLRANLVQRLEVVQQCLHRLLELDDDATSKQMVSSDPLGGQLVRIVTDDRANENNAKLHYAFELLVADRIRVRFGVTRHGELDVAIANGDRWAPYTCDDKPLATISVTQTEPTPTVAFVSYGATRDARHVTSLEEFVHGLLLRAIAADEQLLERIAEADRSA
jgi:hypothetical protein